MSEVGSTRLASKSLGFAIPRSKCLIRFMPSIRPSDCSFRTNYNEHEARVKRGDSHMCKHNLHVCRFNALYKEFVAHRFQEVFHQSVQKDVRMPNGGDHFGIPIWEIQKGSPPLEACFFFAGTPLFGHLRASCPFLP